MLSSSSQLGSLSICISLISPASEKITKCQSINCRLALVFFGSSLSSLIRDLELINDLVLKLFALSLQFSNVVFSFFPNFKVALNFKLSKLDIENTSCILFIFSREKMKASHAF